MINPSFILRPKEVAVVMLGWIFINFRLIDYLFRFKGSYLLFSLLLSGGVLLWLKKKKDYVFRLSFLDHGKKPLLMLVGIAAVSLIPLGWLTGLITWHPHPQKILISPVVFLFICLSISLVEELVFRQTFLVYVEQEWGVKIALAVSSLLFGFSHIVRGTFPNWSYVFLATMAGFLYGYAFKKYGLAQAIFLHSLVDTGKFALFSG